MSRPCGASSPTQLEDVFTTLQQQTGYETMKGDRQRAPAAARHGGAGGGGLDRAAAQPRLLS